VDGNFRAWRHQLKQERKMRERGTEGPRDRFLVERAVIESEFSEAGLQVVGHVDFLKYWDKWRTYVLRVEKP
jgi:hypothetical protein